MADTQAQSQSQAATATATATATAARIEARGTSPGAAFAGTRGTITRSQMNWDAPQSYKYCRPVGALVAVASRSLHAPLHLPTSLLTYPRAPSSCACLSAACLPACLAALLCGRHGPLACHRSKSQETKNKFKLKSKMANRLPNCNAARKKVRYVIDHRCIYIKTKIH